MRTSLVSALRPAYSCFGTVLMVLLMSVVVMPLGVIAAIWLHEYAGRNALTRLVQTPQLMQKMQRFAGQRHRVRLPAVNDFGQRDRMFGAMHIPQD